MSTEDVPLSSDWKQARADHRRLATIVIDSNDAVTVQDFGGRLTAWNRGAERMYGYSEAEALSMSIGDIVPEDRRDEALALVQRIERGADVQSLETQRVSKDGRTLDVWLTVTKLVDNAGNPVAVATTERDITERKKAEKANLRLSALVTSTSDAVVGLMLDGTITDWNTAANRIFGYLREEAIGQNVCMLVPPDRLHELQQIVERLQRGETVEDFETVRTDKDGQSKDVSLTESLIKTPDGQIAGVSSIVRDISERKRSDQQSAQLAEQERQRIGQELHDTTGQELTALGLMAHSLLDQLAAESHPGEETIRKMEESIQRALAQVRRFAQGLVPVELDASGLTTALQELAINTTKASNIRCTFRHDQPVSMADNTVATQIYLIANEAVANAVQHAQAKHVEIELSRYDNDVTLRVRDDGVGIGEPSDGDGMGLRIMRHRAALIQATIEIGPVDKGGTLVMCVATAQRNPGASTMAKTKTKTDKKVAKVLIVDDHPIVRDGLSMRISGQTDMEVCGEAEDVAEALDLIRQTRPDVVVIDIALKTGSGIDLIRRIQLIDESIRLLAISMYSDSLYAERAIRAGAMGYLNKQVATRNITGAIRQVFAGKMYLSEQTADRMLQLARGGEKLEQSPVDRLSDRELQVFELIGRGYSTREIAEHLHLSAKTIDNYRDFIKAKLSLRDSNELLRQATIWVLDCGRLAGSNQSGEDLS